MAQISNDVLMVNVYLYLCLCLRSVVFVFLTLVAVLVSWPTSSYVGLLLLLFGFDARFA